MPDGGSQLRRAAGAVPLRTWPQGLLEGPKIRHVAHNREYHRFGKVPERVQHDVDWKRGAILPSGRHP
jgi:hypothetical protein